MPRVLTGRDMIENGKVENMWLRVMECAQRLMFPASEVAEHMEAQLVNGDGEKPAGGWVN